MTFTVATLQSMDEVEAAEWDALVGPNHPFIEHAFLRALETSGSVGTKKSGWVPRHVVVRVWPASSFSAMDTVERFIAS